MMWAFLSVVAAMVLLVALVWRYFQLMGSDRKLAIKDVINRVFMRAEARGLFPAAPAFERNYLKSYPQLKILEDNYPVIREECGKLLGWKEKMADMEIIGGYYTAGGIHTAKWKTFMFKSGEFIEENCRFAPRTAGLLRQIPNLYTAFFSVLEPHQYIAPHFGYYKGFLRYHLGVIIPDDNADGCCYLRINPNPADNALRDRSLIDRGELYYWKNGEGVMFDDTYLHDARNNSDEIRVILWLDLARKLPWYLHLFNVLVLFIAHQEGTVKEVRRRATLDL
jgi:aspartyl/asparaginyl beta-hydroxylase (cupin superfamily)